MPLIDLNRLRQQNLFDGYGYGSEDYDQNPIMSPFSSQTGPTFPSPFQSPPSPSIRENPNQIQSPTQYNPQNMFDTINKMYTPETASRDRLNNLLDDFPERNQPSWARKLTASMMALNDPAKGGGIAGAENVMYAPYMRDVAAWKEKTGPYQAASTGENARNINERTLVGNIVTATTQAEKLAEQGRQADQKNEIARQRAENDAIRARAYAAKNNGFTVMKAGDRIVAVDPATNRRMDLGPSGGLDRETELDIMGEWGVKRAEAQGEAAVRTAQAGATASGRDLVTIDGVTYKRNEDGSFTTVQGLPSGTPTRPGTAPRPAPNTAKERGESLQEIFSNVWNFSPQYRKFLERDATGGFSMIERPEGPEGDQWDAMVKQINPNYEPPYRPRGWVPYREGMGPQQPVPGSTPSTTPTYNPGGGVQSGSYNPGGGPQTGTYNPGGGPGHAVIQPAPPQGRITVYDAKGNARGHIPNTPEQLALAAKQGLTPRR